MAFKTKLLATAAIPLIALMGMSPVSAAGLVQPATPAKAQSLVIAVQADDEELPRQQRKERRENRQNNRQNNAGQNEDLGNRQNRNRQDNAAQERQENQQQIRRNRQNNDAEMQVQQPDQEQVRPRRKQQSNDAEMQQMQQDNANQAQQNDEEQVKPRRKKQQDNAGQAQQNDQEQVKPRRKQQDNAGSDEGQTNEKLKNAIDNTNRKNRKNQEDNADTQQRQEDNAGQAQQGDEEQVKPRRKQQDNAGSDEGQTTNEKLKNAIDNTNRKNRKNQQDQAAEPTDNSNGSIEKIETRKKQQQAEEGDDTQARDRKRAERPVDVKKAKDIAADPSKTTDTVVLPVENGAAVLDSDKDADNSGADRNRRKQEREEIKQVRAPKSDKDAQRGFREDDQVRIRPVLQDKGERIPGFKGYDDFGGRRVGDRGNRFVIDIGGRMVIRTDDDTRIARSTEIRYERLPNNLVREIIVRPNGDRVVTVRNRWGEIVRRSRIDRNNREIVIFYSPVLERGRDRLFLRDAGANLPPMRLSIPVDDYIIDVSGGGDRNFEEFLDEPPVEPVERVYSVDEVKNSARIRDKMRRIDLDTITFDTGSAEIADDQVQSLQQVGEAIKDILDKDAGETFLIEGHTDAVGSDESNLVLSDSRAESVANVLSQAFDIPAENLVTQGYGERYLKIDSDGPERANRRVTIRRITPLVRPLAAAEE